MKPIFNLARNAVLVALLCGLTSLYAQEELSLDVKLREVAERVEYAGVSDEAKAGLIRQVGPAVNHHFASSLLQRMDDDRAVDALLGVELLITAYEEGTVDQDITPHGAHQGQSVQATLTSCFFFQNKLLRLTEELVDRSMVAPSLKSRLQECFETILQPMERGPNNRPANYAMAQALASRLFPDSEKSGVWSAYAEAVWNDWYGPGDTYEPSYYAHHKWLLELGALLGKHEELRGEKLRQAYDRYLAEIGPSGHVVQSGDGGAYAYAGLESLMATIMKHCPEPTYLWGLRQTFLRAPGRTLEDFVQAYPEYRDMTPQAPDWKSQITKRWPATYETPDNMIMAPRGRADTDAPYARFWLWDDCNFLYHGGQSDSRGSLAHYEVDGVLLMAERGRYDWPAWNNNFVVSEPDAEFPFRRTRGLHAGRWYRGSGNLRVVRAYLPSEDYPLLNDRNPSHFALQDRKTPLGFMWGNPDGPAGKNDEVQLQEIKLEFALLPEEGERAGKVFPGRTWWGGYEYRNVCPSKEPVDVLLRDLFITGPAGEKILLSLDEIDEERISFGFVPQGESEEVALPDEDVGMIADPETGRQVLRLTKRYGRTIVRIKVDQDVHLTGEYNRVGVHYFYNTPIHNWVRTPIHVGINGSAIQTNIKLDRQQGGILTAAKTEDKGEDAYGSVSYQSIWTYDSSWKRRIIMTREGILVVQDEFLPGQAADGMIAGPVWQLPPTALRSGHLSGHSRPKGAVWRDQTRWGEGVSADWFAAPLGPLPVSPREISYRAEADHGEDQLNMFIAFGAQADRVSGSQFQPRHWGVDGNAVYSQGRLEAGRKAVYVSVLVPHAPDIDPDTLARALRIDTFTDRSSRVHLERINHPNWPHTAVTVEFGHDDDWSVKR